MWEKLRLAGCTLFWKQRLQRRSTLALFTPENPQIRSDQTNPRGEGRKKLTISTLYSIYVSYSQAVIVESNKLFLHLRSPKPSAGFLRELEGRKNKRSTGSS
jgi:hypothetical protein